MTNFYLIRCIEKEFAGKIFKHLKDYITETD